MVECLLCLRSEQEIEKCIQVDSTPWKVFGIKKLIDKHLWAIDTIKQNSWLCSLCWEDLQVFHKFYNRIEEAHKVFKSLLKSETGTLQEDNKPKDLQLEMLLEPKIGQTLEPAIAIKHENKEPIVVPSTATTIKDETNKNDDVLLSDREFLDDPDFDDDFRFSCDDSDSDDDMPLMHRLNSDKSTDKSATESKSNDDDSMGRNREDNDEEPTVVPSTATTTKYKTNKNYDALLYDREFLEDPDFDDDFRFSCVDISLIHRLKSDKTTVKSATEAKSKSNDDSMARNGEDNDNSESNPDPLQPNGESKKKTSKSKCSSNKFLQEHYKITCNKCHLPFDTFTLLCKHYREEHNERGFVTCCEVKFFDRFNLVDHINVHLNPEYFKCKVCGKVLAKRNSLSMHMKLHEEKKFQCYVCNKKFVYKPKLERHKLTHLSKSEKEYSCREYDKTTGKTATESKSISNDDDNMNRKGEDNDEEPTVVPSRATTTKEKTNKNDDVLLSDREFLDDPDFDGDFRFSCDDDMSLIHRLKSDKTTVKSATEAKSKSNDNSMGKNGEDKESNPVPLQPNSKSKKKKSKSKRSSNKFLQEHYKITCNKCHLPFDTFPLLCKHYREEHNERGFVTCCEMKFFGRFNLVDHINVHLNPEYFKCKVCGKVLAKRNSLSMHMKLHEEKKFQCDVCNKKFVYKPKLERHKLTHLSESEKEYSCSVYDKTKGMSATESKSISNDDESMGRNGEDTDEEPTIVPPTATTTKYKTNKNDDVLLSHHEFLDDNDFDSDNDMHLIHRLNSVKTTGKSETEAKSQSNDDENMGRNGEDNDEEPTVVPSTATTTKEKPNKNDDVLLSDREFFDDPDFDGDFRFSCDDDMSLIHRLKSDKTTVKSATEAKSNDDSMGKCGEDKDNSETNPVPLQPNSKSKKKKSKSQRSSNKFLQENYKITCNKCHLPFDTFALLCKHYREEHNERGFVTCCELKFFDRFNLVDHINVHLNPEYFKCKVCGKVLAKRNSLSMHMKLHEEKKFQCDVCNKKFVYKPKLERHKLTHLSESEKEYSCSECGKFFGNKNILMRHQRVVHLKTYAKVCEFCGQTLQDSFSFKRHMDQHEMKSEIKSSTPSTTVKCGECGLILAGPLSLKRHRGLRHPVGGKRDYTCNICLKKLIRCTHYKCTMCEKSFTRSENLKSHMSTHTGTPLYCCQWCSKTCNFNSNMWKHQRRVHPVEWEEARRKKYSGNLPPNFV